MKDPIPLLADQAGPAELRSDLMAFRDEPVSFNLESSLASFEARLESGDLTTDADDGPSDFANSSELDGLEGAEGPSAAPRDTAALPKPLDAGAASGSGALGAGAGKLLAILALGAGAGFVALELAGGDTARDASLPTQPTAAELPRERVEEPEATAPASEGDARSFPQEPTAEVADTPSAAPKRAGPAPRRPATPPAEPAPEEGSLPPETAMDQPAPSAPPAADDAPRNPLQREIAQLGEIRKALKADPRRALALADRGHVEFHAGSLYQEREALALRALRALGERDALESRGRAFLLRYPKSSFAREVERLLAE